MSPDRRPAVMAGHFYPRDPFELSQIVGECLEDVTDAPRRCTAAIAPHAALMYSGRCAGAVFGRLSWPQTIVVLGPNHTGVCHSPGASLWRAGAFETPVGTVAIDEAFAAELEAASDLVAHDPSAHRAEHSIEVELPFVAIRSPQTRIVPIVIAWEDWERSEAFAAALAAVVRAHRDNPHGPKDILLLASSDMTHFETPAEAARRDAFAIAAIEAMDGRELLDVCARERVTMCGRVPAAIVLESARRLGATSATVVDYRHSGFVSGSDDSVVSYAGVLIQ